MALPLTRAVSMKFQVVGKQLREVSQSWFHSQAWLGIAPSLPPATPEQTSSEAPANAFSHLHKNGEMNHMGRRLCDACDAEMRLAPAWKTAEGTGSGSLYHWQCFGCGASDETSFRICRCGRQTVLDKHAASARELPISLSAGGCTECERCVICDGILAIGNLKWFYGRWTHLYPDTEVDRQTGQQYAVTRERSKYYGFHCHFSCFEKDPQTADRYLADRTPDWYALGMGKQQMDEAERLHKQGRCLICKDRLDWWSRLLDRDHHPKCQAQ